MKKSCGIWFAVYLIGAAAIAVAVYRRFPEAKPAAFAALIGGFFLWLGLAYLVGIRKKIVEGGVINRALSGVPPRDGESIAAIGRITPTSGSLTAPFSGTPCVAYKYEVTVSSGEDSTTLYDGFALTPSVIQGRSSSVRLLAWPEMKVKTDYLSGDAVERNARDYIAHTEFQQPALSNIRAALSDMMAVARDDDGNVRYDRRGGRGDGSGTDLRNARFTEQLLRPGEPVCVTGGRYSAQRGGIIPAPDPLMEPVTLVTGEAESFGGRGVRGAIGYLIGGIIFAGGVIAALLIFYAVVPLDAAEQMKPETKFSWPEIRFERFIDRKLRTPLRQAGMLSSNSEVAIQLPIGSATGRVRGGGRDETVSSAAATKTTNYTTISIDGDKAMFMIDKHNQLMALRILGRDLRPADADLRIAGRDDESVNGRLTIFSDAAAARVAFNAKIE